MSWPWCGPCIMPPQTPPQTHTSKRLWYVLAVVAVLAVGAYIAYSYVMRPSQRYSVADPVSDILRRTNSDFNLAGTYVKQFDFANAKASYERALAEAEDVAQE